MTTHYEPYRAHYFDEPCPCRHCGQVEDQHWSDGLCFSSEEIGARLQEANFAPRPDASTRGASA